jgi:hypothetical protein
MILVVPGSLIKNCTNVLNSFMCMVIFLELYGNKSHLVIIPYLQPEISSPSHSSNTLKILLKLTGREEDSKGMSEELTTYTTI